MPATISRGKTFGATETVTNTKLHQLVDNATISGIDQTNIASGYGLAIRSTSAPTSTDAIWVDTNCSPPVVKIYSGSEWVVTGAYAVLTNKSGGSIAAGDVVVVDTTTAGSFTTSTVGSDITVLGVAMQSIANNADGVIALAGARVLNVAVDGTVTKGQFLKTSTVAKQATPTSTGDTGVFAIALSSRSGAGALDEVLLIGTNVTSAGLSAASQAEMEAASSTTKAVTPGRTQYHPGVAKAWVTFNGTGTVAITASHNVSSITDNGLGDYTVNFTTAMSSATYGFSGMSRENAGTTPTLVCVHPSVDPTASAFRLRCFDVTNNLVDSALISLHFYGDQ